MTGRFDLCGDHLALDFVNTLNERHSARPRDALASYGDLLDFLRESAVVDGSQCAVLRAAANADPAGARKVLTEALALRESLYRVFAAVLEDRQAPLADRQTLGGELARLTIGPDLSIDWRREPGRLDSVIGALVQAATSLVTSPEQRRRICRCEAPDCGWLFYDGSRNRSRRWCDMRQCGNRMKARRHYARRRKDR